ncbi:SRPBCC domain-containing protein [uncultured Algibacter sp.]|uniref:SRPBCC family protein n=1 Tax=uncultured Algibacter sp. TaxID=298659 RepID=UPI002626BFDB|nr:SRPBCC domain-containing protein [uncultured Algibacter sp.]
MSDLNSRTLTIEKTFNAPLKVVWDTWIQAEHIVKWWAPKGMNVEVLEHDFNVGGTWKYNMPMPDGSAFISEGTYKQIIEFEKIVTSADFKPMTEKVELIVLFEADGNQTKFKFSVVHATPEYCRQQEEMGFYNGWGSAFERLKDIVEAL